MANKQKLLFTLALAQGGEFAFVLLSLTANLQILTPEQVKITTLVVAISMLFAPILLLIYEHFILKESAETKEFDDAQAIEPAKNVIIAGYGRFGQIIGRLLTAQGYHLSVLDHSPSQIDLLRRFGNKVFYGDAARQDLLEASGAKEAQLLVIAIEEPDKTLEIIELAKRNYPNLKIVARAIDRRHAYQLMQLGVHGLRRETFDSAVKLGVETLKVLGISATAAEKAGQLFIEHDEESIKILADVWGNDQSYGVAVRQRMEDLKQVLQQDKIKNEQLKNHKPSEAKEPSNA
jgi:glutathione-regulated potassium-efflux system ancillary protein KefC/glutathione-regulated potassium-efflux system protein KefB